MLQEFLGGGAAPDVDAETHAQEGLEFLAEFLGLLETGGAVGGDQVESLEGFFVQVRGFGFNHLNRHDTQGPAVHLGPVFFLLDDFGSHPVRGADHGGTLALGFGEFGAEAKVGCFLLVPYLGEREEKNVLILTLPNRSSKTLSLLISR